MNFIKSFIIYISIKFQLKRKRNYILSLNIFWMSYDIEII